MNPLAFVLAGVTLLATAAQAAAVPAPAGQGAAPEAGEGSGVVVLARERVWGHDVAATAAGDVVAVWERSRGTRHRVLGAVRPAAGEWAEPVVLARWTADRPDDRGDDSRGDPQVTTGPDGSVLAVWIDARHRVVRAIWQAGGWSDPRPLSGRGEAAQGPRVVSDAAGRAAVTWQQRDAGRLLVRAAVRRDAGWFRSTVGGQGPRGLGAAPAVPGLDGAGNLTVAWYRLRPKPPHSGDGLHRALDLSLASRLPAGGTHWEEPHAFGEWEPFFDDERPALVVEADGTAWVADWAGGWDAPQPGPMWTREGDGPWIADDRAPFAVRFATAGEELISWGGDDTHTQERLNTRQPDGTWAGVDLRATTVVVDAAGHAAAVGVRQGTVLAWVRDGTGTWGPEQVIATNAVRQNDRGDEPVASAAIAPDGTVTVLWGTYANEFPGDHPEDGPDLRTVRFSAVP